MSPRTQEAIEVLHGERRRAILDAALDSFVENGFEGTRIQQIADRCGMSYGLVYRYFPTKEAIFRSLLEEALGAASTMLAALPARCEPELLGELAARVVADPSPRYFFVIIEALSTHGVPAELAAMARESIGRFHERLTAAVGDRAGGADGGGAGLRAEGLLAVLLGASIMKICGLSDGGFASRAALTMAAADRG